jgi:tRNA (guanine-N7-)-methyltransferase
VEMRVDEELLKNLSTRGLVGGKPEMRVATRKVEEIEHTFFLRPLENDAHARGMSELATEGPLAVEIGFGRGYFLVHLAQRYPEWRFLGFEVKRKLCREALARIEKLGVENARILLGDARSLLLTFVPPKSIHALFILFPDPWWKKKHHKRRLLDPETLQALAPLLAPGALIVVRSDVPMVMDLARKAVPSLGRVVPVEDPGMELPQTDRERVCDRIGIPYEQLCFRLEGEA